MYNLSEKQFKPAVFFLSIIFFPLLLGVLAVLICNFDMIILIIFLMLLLVYITLIIFYKKISNNKNHNLIIYDCKMVINYPNINNMKHILEISYDSIIKLEYYKITSLVSWFQLLNGIVPKCVFITYIKNGKEVCELMGHMELNDIKKIANDKNIKLIIK